MTLIVLVIPVALLMLAPGLVVGPSLDAAVFSHVGGRLLDGAAPYLGAWDHKPPATYLASAAAQGVLGWLGPWNADWLASLAATAGIGAAVGALLARLGVIGWPRILGAVGATLLASHYLLALGGGLTEAPATALAAWAMVLAFTTGSAIRATTIGALVALSLLFSVQLAPAAIAVLGLALAGAPASARPSRLAAMTVGLAAPLVAAGAWLTFIGVLPAAVDAVVGYSTAYRASSGEYGGTLGAPVASWTVLSSLFLIMPALLGAASLARSDSLRRGLILASLAWIVGSLALFVVQGRFYAHYAIPLAVPLGVLAGLGLDRMRGSWTRAGSTARRAIVAMPLLITLAVSVLAGVLSAQMQLAPVADQAARMQAVARRLADLPQGSLLVWGNAPRLYDLAHRAPATRYSYFYPITTPGYSTAGMVDAIARQLAADPPAVIVDAGSPAPGEPGFLPLLIDRPITTDGRDLDLLDPLRAFVADRYERVDTVAGWPIYVRRTAAADSSA